MVLCRRSPYKRISYALQSEMPCKVKPLQSEMPCKVKPNLCKGCAGFHMPCKVPAAQNHMKTIKIKLIWFSYGFHMVFIWLSGTELGCELIS